MSPAAVAMNPGFVPMIPNAVPVIPIEKLPRRSRRTLLIAASIVAVLAIAGYGGYRVYLSRQLPAREAISVDEKHRQTHDAFTSAAAVSPSDQETRDISATLDRFNVAMQQKNGAVLFSMFDVDRLWDELDRMGALASVPLINRSQYKTGFGNGFRQSLTGQFTDLNWTTHAVKKISLSSNRQEAVVYDLETHGVGTAKRQLKIRWWMIQRNNQWKIWDIEVLQEGYRVSTYTASAMTALGTNNPALASLQQFNTELHALSPAITRRDWPAAEIHLRVLATVSLLPQQASLCQFFWATVHAGEQKWQDVLKDCDAIDATGQDVPIVNQFRTMADIHLGRYDEALTTSYKWEDALGGDEDVYYERGLALTHLNRLPEAAVAFGKSLDDDPDAAASLARLSLALPAGQKSQVGARFAQCQTPIAVFKGAMSILVTNKDAEGMKSLLDAYQARPESAGDPFYNYYDAEIKVLNNQYREAEIELKPLLPQATQTGKEKFETEYLYSALNAGDAVAAYQSVKDQQPAFLLLARRLLAIKNYNEIRQLSALHTQNFPDDPWGYYFQAKADEGAGQSDAADAAYAKAMALPDVENAATFRTARVYARYKSGAGQLAYQQIAPKDLVFAQLAGLFANGKQADELAALVIARRADAPDDPAVFFYDADARFLAGDYAAAAAILTSNRAAITQDKTVRYRFTDLYIRSELRLKNIDAARAELANSANAAAGAAETDYFHTAMVEAAAGNVDAATQAMDALLADDDGYDVGDFYTDPDIGPALAAPGFAAWRQKKPAPATQPSPDAPALNAD